MNNSPTRLGPPLPLAQLTPRERRAYILGEDVAVRASDALELLESLLDECGLTENDATGALRVHLERLLSLGKQLQEKPAPTSYATQFILHGIQKHSRDLEAVVSIHMRNLFPGTGGEVPDPLEQLKEHDRAD